MMPAYAQVQTNVPSAPVSNETMKGKIEIAKPVSSMNQPKEISLNSGLTIPIVFTNQVNSKNVRKGDTLPIIINQDVVIDGIVIFKKGSQGVAFIEDSKTARTFGRPGSIDIETGKLTDVYGNEHTVGLSSHSVGNSCTSAIILPIISAVILWPLVFFAFKKGDEVSIPAGKIFNAFITAPETIKINTL